MACSENDLNAWVNGAKYSNGAALGSAPVNAADMCGQMQPQASTPYHSLRDEAQKRSSHHAQEASKAAEAANFFHLHPEFEEFIRLIRSGSIHI
jgi:hypothetical protein